MGGVHATTEIFLPQNYQPNATHSTNKPSSLYTCDHLTHCIALPLNICIGMYNISIVIMDMIILYCTTIILNPKALVSSL